MEPIDMYARLITVQSEIQDKHSTLLSIFCVNHKDSGPSKCGKNKALSNILKKSKELSAIKCMNYEHNKRKFFIYPFPNGDTDIKISLKDEIDIENLDPATVYNLLVSVKGFPTYKTKLHRRRILLTCKNSLHQQCCLACNHKCKVCGKKECTNESICHGEGMTCNHECQNCNEMKEICLHFSSVCCKKCKLCTYCGVKLTLNSEDKCERLKLVLALDELYKLTELFATLTLDDCKEFLDHRKKLPGFATCKTWNDLSEYILQKYHDVQTFMCNKENFRRKHATISKEDVEENEKTLSRIFDDDLDDILVSHYYNVMKIIAFAQTSYGELEERQSIIRRLSDLNNNKNITKECDSVKETQKMLLENMENVSPENASNDVMEDNIVSENVVDVQKDESPLYRTESINPFELSSSSSSSSLQEEDRTSQEHDQNNESPSDNTNTTEGKLVEPEIITTTIVQSSDNKIALIEDNVNNILEELKKTKEENTTFHNEIQQALGKTQEGIQEQGNLIEEKVLSQIYGAIQSVEKTQDGLKISYEELKSEIQDIKETQATIKELLLAMNHKSNLKSMQN